MLTAKQLRLAAGYTAAAMDPDLASDRQLVRDLLAEAMRVEAQQNAAQLREWHVPQAS